VIFLAIFGCKRVNFDEMDGDRLRLPANRNCYSFRASRELCSNYLFKFKLILLFPDFVVRGWVELPL